MARDFYAYLPALVARFYEGIAEDHDGLTSVLDGFLRSMRESEMEVLVEEIDRLFARTRTDNDLLHEVWQLGARDIPDGDVRAALSCVLRETRLRLGHKPDKMT